MMPKERYIEFDVTYKCSAQCKHCILVSGPKKCGLVQFIHIILSFLRLPNYIMSDTFYW